ncbi:MAG: hypothetical protein O6920_07220 [Chloroflexi bacterium]|nr:hypothetical protein [Chloroflexota bacterium]
MATEAPPSLLLQTCDYILSRLTTYFGSRPDSFSAFIDGNVKAHGWLPAEAYVALTTPVTRERIKVTAVRGKVQGEAKFNPDLEININEEYHQLAVIPVLTTADEPLADQMEKGLAEAFQWLSNMKARSIIYLLAFPGGLQDEEWQAGLAKAEEVYQAKAVGQMQFVLPRPPKPMLHASAAVLLHTSKVPAPTAEGS